jgi:predicted dehydrogenase
VVRFALLGVGDVAQRDYLPEFHRLGGRAEVVAACGRSEERVRSVAESYGIPRWFTDYERMLAEEETDAVINLTPIQLHAETNLACLKAGKHLYSEKPLASTSAEARRLQEEAERRGLTIVCAPCVALFPQVAAARALIESGAVGRISSARAVGHMGVPPWEGFKSDPTPYFARGAGPALDMGVYPLHTLTYLLGPVRRVTALVSQVMEEFAIREGPYAGTCVRVETPDNWQLVLDFGGGALATVSANSCVAGTLAPEVELYGLQGTIALEPLDVSRPVRVLRDGAWEEIPPAGTGRESGPDHHLGIEHLVDCLEHVVEPVLSAAAAIHVLDVIEQGERSSCEGRTMEIR